MAVSSHLPARGGSAQAEAVREAIRQFPVTSPRGEDLVFLIHVDLHFQVSSHLPARGGSSWLLRMAISSSGFQSPPREGRIAEKLKQEPEPDVSSHLPARGGSSSALQFLTVKVSFQSPPREGRILSCGLRPLTPAWFPVTSPRGEDQGFPVQLAVLLRVSSHLPARGGSSSPCVGCNQERCFQSPPREGRISFSRGSAAGGYSFQSPPREGRILGLQINKIVC